MPPHPRVLLTSALLVRLRGRGTETEEKIQVRVGNAAKEIVVDCWM